MYIHFALAGSLPVLKNWALRGIVAKILSNKRVVKKVFSVGLLFIINTIRCF